MANQTLFTSHRGKRLPAVNTLNREGAGAYAYAPKHKLAQYAATGCLNNTFYATGEQQLATILALTRQIEPEFVAKTAIYARRVGKMKDMPALLLAALSTRSVHCLKRAFPRVIDNGRMLRNFVQILRSGAVGRKSLGSAPKALVRQWLSTASEQALLNAAIGNSPSLKDVVRMVHPKPSDAHREAFYGWLLDKPYASEKLPQCLQALALYKVGQAEEVPEVPFQMLTALSLGRKQWAQIAEHAGWQMTRMNLNTFARHGVFELRGTAKRIAAKLRDREAIERARVFPYQLMSAYYETDQRVPKNVRGALHHAMNIALEKLPALRGRVVVCPDVSGSMASPITGGRRGATTKVRCVDVAALMTAAVMRSNRDAVVLPFERCVREALVDPNDSVLTNAERLAAMNGGGTNCSAPLRWLLDRHISADLVILISDNQSWVDARTHGATELMRLWETFRQHNRTAKLVCIDLQPLGSTQAAERQDVLNVGGFSDAVFEVVARFARDELGTDRWVGEIEAIKL